jgi:outer membrane protein TolC
MKFALTAACLALALMPRVTHAQVSPDSLRLESLRAASLSSDPRAAQIELLASQSLLRLRNIGADLRPSLSLDGLAQYQSDVAKIDVSLPGVSLPMPKRDTYDARVGAQQKLYDPTISPRRSVERAQLAESQARVRSALYLLSESVNAAYFTALRSQTAIAELETTLTDLEAQLTVAGSRVRAGTALPSESNAISAELLRRRQTIAEQRAARKAAIAILADLSGKPIDTLAPLSSPDLTAETNAARTGLASIRARPEYEQFARSRDVIEQSASVRAAQDKPRVVAFGRAGYGRPGLNPLADKFDTYWLGGIQFQWTPWTWGTTSRERQLAALQRQIVSTEEEAFTAQIKRAIEQDLAAIDRLESALADDDRIIALREDILAETRRRYRESVITSAEFVDRQTDVLSARLNRAIHRVELAQAQAHLLTTLGVEIR